MKPFWCTLLLVVLASGCLLRTPVGTSSQNFAEARKGFQTNLVRRESANTPVDRPPPKLFGIVQYDVPLGKLAAYLTPDPGDGKKHPAILWITGGDCNTIGDVWSPAPPDNDQTASAYRKAGIVMMFPSLRGGNTNPGVRECFLGEVDDVIAAAEFLAKQPYVDPQRIYLGGHSTGGSLVLLVSEASDRFRAVFSFGPVDDIRGYGSEYTPFDGRNPLEAQLRAPGRWLASIKQPTFVIEGTDGNIDSLHGMARSNDNPQVHFLEARGSDHFAVLGPTNRLLAEKVLADTGPTCNIMLTEADLAVLSAGDAGRGRHAARSGN